VVEASEAPPAIESLNAPRRRAGVPPPWFAGPAVGAGEISTILLKVRASSGPDSVCCLGSAKFTNEAAYLYRKIAAFWGTNNAHHQARICHSTTVTGVANTRGYGAVTNSYNDIRNSKTRGRFVGA
jgi:anaerobic selenocysteine-containing dehydrogenase